MPVVRLSQSTWERLQAHARPFEDTPDNIITAALDQLDKLKGVRVAKAKAIAAAAQLPPKGPKTPQKAFRLPLFRTLRAMGGGGRTRDVRRLLKKRFATMRLSLNDADLALVSSGDPRWWNAVCWERRECLKEGLLRRDSERGVWELSRKGKKWLRLNG